MKRISDFIFWKGCWLYDSFLVFIGSLDTWLRILNFICCPFTVNSIQMRWLKVNFSETDLNAIRLVCTVLNKVWNTLTLYCLLVYLFLSVTETTEKNWHNMLQSERYWTCCLFNNYYFSTNQLTLKNIHELHYNLISSFLSD